MRHWPSALYRLGEVREKFVGQFLGGAVDQALAELRQLAADLRLDLVGQKRAAVLLRKLDHGATLGKAGHPALAFAGDLVAVRRVEIGQRDLALEARRHRTDLHFRRRAKAAIVGLLQLLAAGDAGLQHLGIVELGPHGLARRRKLDFAVHRHGHWVPPGIPNLDRATIMQLKYRTEAAKERVALGHVQCIFATAKSLRRRFGIGTGGSWWLGPAQYEHIPLPPARADAVERGHARGLRRPVAPSEYARIRGSPRPSRGGHGCDSRVRGGPDRSRVQGRYL